MIKSKNYQDCFRKLVVKIFNGRIDYESCLKLMQDTTRSRNENTTDELWILEHNHVFTQGHAMNAEFPIQESKDIAVKTDRGGQVTYHAPGQMIIYTLLDIKKLNIKTRELVRAIEGVIIECLHKFGIYSSSSTKAPGIYVGKEKICSIGLRIKQGYSYHGLSLNINMDLSKFLLIKPCGFDNIKMNQVQNIDKRISFFDIRETIIASFVNKFKYDCTMIIYKEKLG